MAKQLDQLEGKLAGVLLDNLSAEASTATIRVMFFERDDQSVAREPNSDTLKFLIDPENTQGKGKLSEWIRCDSHATVDGITTLTNVTRGLQRDHTIDLTGSATRAESWDAGAPIGVATEPHNMNYLRAMLQEGTEQIPGNVDMAGTLDVDGVTTVKDKLQFTSTNTYMDEVGTDMVFKDANNVLTTLSDLTAGAGVDTKASVSANDTTSGFLNGKLVAGEGVTFTENNDGGDETLTIASPTTASYAVDSVGTDAYAISLPTALTAYADGQLISFEAGTENTGPATLDVDSLGAIPIIKGDYFALIDGDIVEDQKVLGQVSVKEVTFNAAFVGGETSGTLASNWTYKTGVYSVEFSNGDRRDVTLTKGNTTATWSGGLSGAATADAEAQWFQMHTFPTDLTGGNNASEQHYHDLVRNRAISRRVAVDMVNGAAYITAAANNSIDQGSFGMGVSLASLVTLNPSFRVYAFFANNTAQEGFIGVTQAPLAGTDIEDSVFTKDHFGFVIEDGTISISVADGTNQSSSAIVGTVTNTNIYEAYFDGSTATFYLNNTLVGTLNTNVPDNNLSSLTFAVISDASAQSRQLTQRSYGIFAFDEGI